MNTYLEVKNLTKQFNGKLILDHINFQVQQHEFVVIVGASGCGKSTLLRILAGLDQPDLGKVYIQGHSSIGISEDKTIIFQEPRLFPWLSVADNILLGTKKDMPSSELDHLLEKINLTEFKNTLPHQLSGGMAQRVAIARSLITKPKLLLLDEPFSALDPITRHKMQQELLNIHRQSNITTLLITHDIEEAIQLADRIIILLPYPVGIVEIVNAPFESKQDSYAIFNLKEYIHKKI